MAKRNSFIIIGIGLITAFILFGKHTSIYAAVKEGAKFEDWIVTCEKVEDPKKKSHKTCYLTQSLFKDEKKIAEFKIGYFGANKTLQMIQVLPFGVQLAAGTMIIVDKEVMAPGKFVTCYNYGCVAVATLKEEELKKIYGKDETYIGMAIVDAEKQINLKFSTKGLKKGLESLK